MSVEKMVDIVTLQIQKYDLKEKDMLDVMSKIYNKEFVVKRKSTNKKKTQEEEKVNDTESKD